MATNTYMQQHGVTAEIAPAVAAFSACELGEAAGNCTAKADADTCQAKVVENAIAQHNADCVGPVQQSSVQAMFAGRVASQIEEDGPRVYRCTQGTLFVKRSENPDSQKILKLKRPIGSFVHTTGYTWTGSAGGVWAELDAGYGDMGWMLVRGPGFGLTGPALIDAADLQEATSLQVVLVEEEAGIIFKSWVRRDVTIADVKKMVGEATGLQQRYCCLIKDPPAKIPGTEDRLTADYCQELKDESTLQSFGCGDSLQLFLLYLGDYPKGFQKPKPIAIKYA